jgi:hypothetical protein
MRTVKMVRFLQPGNELWGRRVSVLRAEDGYVMKFDPATGLLFITDHKDGGEVGVHPVRCDFYLAEQAPKAEAKK